MPPASQPMYELQLVEGRLEAERAALHAVETQLRSNPAIERARVAVEKLETQAESIRSRLRRVEAQAEDAEAKAKKLTATLYGGAIHDSREMATMESEIAHAKAEQSRMEDEELELLDSQEKIETQLGEQSAQLETLVSDREGSLGHLREEQARRAASVKQLESEHDSAMSAMDKSTLANYQRLRDRSGHAVSVVENGVCQWCRVQIPAKDIQHARGDTLVTCMNCGRVLHAG